MWRAKAVLLSALVIVSPPEVSGQGIVLLQDTLRPSGWIKRVLFDTTGFEVTRLGYQFSMGVRYDRTEPLPPVWMSNGDDHHWERTIVRCGNPPRWRTTDAYATTVESDPDAGHPAAALTEACRLLSTLAARDSLASGRTRPLTPAQIARAAKLGIANDVLAGFMRTVTRGFDLRPAGVLPEAPADYLGTHIGSWLIRSAAVHNRVTCDGDARSAACGYVLTSIPAAAGTDLLRGTPISVAVLVRDSLIQRVSARYPKRLLRSDNSDGLDQRTVDVLTAYLGPPTGAGGLTEQRSTWRGTDVLIERTSGANESLVTWTWTAVRVR
jgi:hypothetical protein